MKTFTESMVMKAGLLILLSLILLMVFFMSGGTAVGAGSRAAGSQLAGSNEPALAFNKIASATTTGTTTRISVASDGTQGNSNSSEVSISADGRYVAFRSQASNLVSGDTNGYYDIFVHDTQTGQTTRVSVASDGTQGNNISNARPAISANGRYVAFSSFADNLVPNDTNGANDIFVHDTQTGQTSRISVASDGTQGNGGSSWPSIAGDGRFVAFLSGASNLVNNDTNDRNDIFVYDLQTNQIERVSVASDGTQGNNHSSMPSISADGRYVTFESASSNLGDDTYIYEDVFIYDRQLKVTKLISVNSAGQAGNNISYRPTISADGRFVAFLSKADNLVTGDANNRRDAFVHDLQTGVTELVSVSSDGQQASRDIYGPVAISANGRYVIFMSQSSNLVPNDTCCYDVFVHDRQTGITERISVDSTDQQGNSASGFFGQSISSDGRFIVFDSLASNLVLNDTNGVYDIFVRDRGTGSGTYSISGQVTDGNSNPIEGVTLSTASGATTTNASGYYTFTTLITGTTYTLTPSKAGYAFTPASSTISVPPDAPSQDFVGVAGGSPPTPFLDLPFGYGGTSQSFITSLQNWNDDGRVNSWFDHKYPDYSSNNGTGMWLYNGKYINNSYWSGSVLCFASYCYDGHDGIDLSYKDPQPGVSGSQALPILAAASGTVAASNNTCPNYPVPTCGGGYGNYVILYHTVGNGNGYFTRYGHLASVGSIPTTVNAGDTLGIMGNSGRSGGTHLHFGVYKDNGNGQWDGESIDKPVDPYGWKLSEPDPWVAAGGPVSSWLWLYDSDKQVSFSGDQGASFTDMTGNVQVTVPANAFSGQISLELSPSPVAGASAQLRNGGSSFWLRLLQWLSGVSNTQGVVSIQNSSQLTSTLPITFTVAYTDANILHLNESQLALYYWDEGLESWQSLPTTVNTAGNLVTAQTEQLGAFSLQAPLICPADNSEPDDSFYRAASISTNGALTNRLFDIAEDQDWFSFNAAAGESYVLEAKNLTAGVDTIIKVYDQDGLTLLASDDNSGNGAAPQLEWTSPQDGTYFVQVTPASGSSYGCNATYEFSVQGGYSIYLPAVIRN